jgi:RimJ/RimL family protein N-acetyltransferase
MLPVERRGGIYRLERRHEAAIQLLAPAVAAAGTTRLPHPYPGDGAQRFVARVEAERADGRTHVFAVEERGALVGVCGLEGIEAGGAELGFWIGAPFRGQGWATFAVRTLLPFAFTNLRLPRVVADTLATNTASRHVLAKCGFAELAQRPHREPRWPADVPLVRHEITPAAFAARRDAPALAALCAQLRGLLEGELAAGNEIVETGIGWPDPDSVLVRLRHPFRARPAVLPAGVRHHEPNDPHWWRGELSSERPRHLLVH